MNNIVETYNILLSIVWAFIQYPFGIVLGIFMYIDSTYGLPSLGFLPATFLLFVKIITLLFFNRILKNMCDLERDFHPVQSGFNREFLAQFVQKL